MAQTQRQTDFATERLNRPSGPIQCKDLCLNWKTYQEKPPILMTAEFVEQPLAKPVNLENKICQHSRQYNVL